MDSMTRDAFEAQLMGRDVGKRSRSRDSLFLMAQVRIDGEGEAREVRVRNLSEGGMMAEFARPLAVGTAMTLDLRGVGEVRGRVAWSTQGRIGIALDEAIDPKAARKPVGTGPKTPVYAKAPRFR